MSNTYYSSGPTPPMDAYQQTHAMNSGIPGPQYYPPANGAAAPGPVAGGYDQYGQQRQVGGQAGPPNRPFSPGGRPLKIYVANVGPQIKSFHLQEKFIQFGNITNIEEFTDADSALRAVAGGDGTELMGNILRVEAQKPRRPRGRVMMGGGMPYGMRGGQRMGRYLPYPEDFSRRRYDMYGARPYDYPPAGYPPDPYHAPYGRSPAPYPARPPYQAAPMTGAPGPGGAAMQTGYNYGQPAPAPSNEYQPQAPYVPQQMPYQQPDYSQMQTTSAAYETGATGAYETGAVGGAQVGQPLMTGGTTEALTGIEQNVGLPTNLGQPNIAHTGDFSESALATSTEQANEEATAAFDTQKASPDEDAGDENGAEQPQGQDTGSDNDAENIEDNAGAEDNTNADEESSNAAESDHSTEDEYAAAEEAPAADAEASEDQSEADE